MTRDKFLKLKTVKRAIEKYGQIPQNNLNIIIDEILKYKSNPKILDLYYHIAVMGILGSRDEIPNAINKKINSNKKSGVSLYNYCEIYGKTCGTKLYNDWVKTVSVRNTITSSSEHLIKKFTESGYNDYKISKNKKQSDTKIKNNKVRNVREDSPLCEEYYHKNGIFDEKYIKDALTKAKQKSWIYAYTPEQKMHTLDKLAKTKSSNIRNGKIPKSAGYSKQANKFFKNLLLKLSPEISEKVITQITVGREYWVRNSNDKDVYYFVDFCIPNVLAIEYHGNAYHPKNEYDENYRAFLLGGLSCKDKYYYDRIKAESIRLSNMQLLEVWDNEIDLNKIINWIEDVYYGR